MRRIASTAKPATSRIPSRTSSGSCPKGAGDPTTRTCDKDVPVTSPLSFARRALFVLLIAAALPSAASAQEALSSRLGAYLAGRIAASERDMAAASRYYAHALEA